MGIGWKFRVSNYIFIYLLIVVWIIYDKDTIDIVFFTKVFFEGPDL